MDKFRIITTNRGHEIHRNGQPMEGEVFEYFAAANSRCKQFEQAAETAEKMQRANTALNQGAALSGIDKPNFTPISFGSPVYQYHLIPKVALDSLAKRLELGTRRHSNPWNASTSNSDDYFFTKDWITARLNHVISHAMKALQKINNAEHTLLEHDDDAGAIMFGGCVLAVYNDYQQKLAQSKLDNKVNANPLADERAGTVFDNKNKNPR